MAIDLHGIWAALLTPFDHQEEVDLEALAFNVELYGQTPLKGYVVLGTTGEYPHLADAECGGIIETAVQVAQRDERPVIAGVGGHSVSTAVQRARAAARAGAAGILLWPPYYYRPALADDVLERYFLSVAEASPVPVILYHIPSHTGVTLSPALVGRVAAHPNVVGIKDSSGRTEQTIAYLRESGPGFQVLVGTGTDLLAALAAGAAGAILAVANVAPWECCEIYAHSRQGRWADAAQVYRRVAVIDEAVGSMGVGGWKAVAEMLGYRTGPPRSPLNRPDEAQLEQLRLLLREQRLLGC